jgi:hypothetical protein
LKKLFILHALPLELYPPVTNLLNVLDEETNLKTAVFSTHNTFGKADFKLKNIPIYRSTYPGNAANVILKIWYFFMSVAIPVFRMLVFKPDILLYFEPHSAFPAYIYKKFFNKKVRVFIHYHEYYTKTEFKAPAMASVNFYHQREIDFLYEKAVWISQTNSDRLNFFSVDYPDIAKEKLHVLANYPPASWYTEPLKPVKDDVIKLFYIGAISFGSTYIREIVDFVSVRPNSIQLDIYSYNIHSDAKSFLEALDVPNIKFFDKGIPYNEIPKIASQYHIGLVLYKPHNTNYLYNAPNKLFEYLVCGLDVMLPETLLGCQPLLNRDTKPNVIAVNFENLSDSDFECVASKNQQQRVITFNCEMELKPLIKQFKH